MKQKVKLGLSLIVGAGLFALPFFWKPSVQAQTNCKKDTCALSGSITNCENGQDPVVEGDTSGNCVSVEGFSQMDQNGNTTSCSKIEFYVCSEGAPQQAGIPGCGAAGCPTTTQ